MSKKIYIFQPGDSVCVTEEDDDDVETALKKEVDEIRSSIQKDMRRFQSIDSGVSNIVFIKTFNVEPEKLVHHILKDLHTTKKQKTRVILRMLPVSGTCRAYPADLEKYAETFLELWFKAPNKGTFQITFKARYNSHMIKDDVIKDLAHGTLHTQNSDMKVSVVLFLLALSLSTAKDATSHSKESKAKKHKPPKFKEEDHVLILTDSNFARALKENKYLLVKFYITLSGPSQTVKEEFSVAATQIKTESPDVRFGQVDITQEKELGKEFKIKEYPTIKLFVDGDRNNPIDCRGVRTSSAFVTWINRRMGPSSVSLNTTEQFESFIQSDKVAVVGFFKNLESKILDHFSEAARDIPEFPFGLVNSEEIFLHVGINANLVAVYKKDKAVNYLISEGETENHLDLVRLIRTYIMDLVTEYNLETSVMIFDVPIQNHILLFASKTSESFSTIYENYELAALEFRGKLVFVYVNTDETRNGRIFEYFRITEVDSPAVRIANLTSNKQYRMPADDVNFTNLRNFCQNYLDGKAKPKTDSEEIPSDWDKNPVKVLVGKNFNHVAFNKATNAFVMFYAPWSEECKTLFPVWEDLGRRYQNHNNVTIAKIDCTANDIQLVVLDRHPYFRFFPSGSDTKTIRYTGARTVEAFAEYIEQQLRAAKGQDDLDHSGTRESTENKEKSLKEEL
uniref:protein disulfide-isomerase n=1 Tax=Leptobrachium leishanense TaxID=445787 RepID=A0A8C5WIL7_9ANUR